MTDCLRDRIAAVLREHRWGTAQSCVCGGNREPSIQPEHVADAVIAAMSDNSQKSDIDRPAMSVNGSLRHRIAATMFNADNGGIVAYLETDEPEILDTNRVIDGEINFAKLADAVIAALGLRQETGEYDGFFGRKPRRRYVTEWDSDNG